MEEFMRRMLVLPVILSVFLLAGCGQKDGTEAAPDSNAPHATVSLRDGTTITGTVTSSTPSQITLNMDSGGTRTMLMKNVRSVDYGDAGNVAGNVTAGNRPSAPVPSTPGSSAPRPSAPRPPPLRPQPRPRPNPTT